MVNQFLPHSNIRLCSPRDAAQIRDIYAPFCSQDCIVSFELEAPSLSEMAQRIEGTLQMYPWLVWEEGGQVAGYAYAGAHRQRPAYQWSVDTSIYLHPRCQKKGVGSKLYNILLTLLRAQGFYNAYAGITLPNEGSVHLHKKVGFKDLTVYPRVGFKAGKWLDVAWYQLQLVEPSDDHPPSAPIAINNVLAQGNWFDAPDLL